METYPEHALRQAVADGKAQKVHEMLQSYEWSEKFIHSLLVYCLIDNDATHDVIEALYNNIDPDISMAAAELCGRHMTNLCSVNFLKALHQSRVSAQQLEREVGGELGQNTTMARAKKI